MDQCAGRVAIALGPESAEAVDAPVSAKPAVGLDGSACSRSDAVSDRQARLTGATVDAIVGVGMDAAEH